MALCGDGEWNAWCRHLAVVRGRKRRNCLSSFAHQKQGSTPNRTGTENPWVHGNSHLCPHFFLLLFPLLLGFSFGGITQASGQDEKGAWGWSWHIPPSSQFSWVGWCGDLQPPTFLDPWSFTPLRTHFFNQGTSQVALVVRNPPANAGDIETWIPSWVRKILWRRAGNPL